MQAMRGRKMKLAIFILPSNRKKMSLQILNWKVLPISKWKLYTQISMFCDMFSSSSIRYRLPYTYKRECTYLLTYLRTYVRTHVHSTYVRVRTSNAIETIISEKYPYSKYVRQTICTYVQCSRNMPNAFVHKQITILFIWTCSVALSLFVCFSPSLALSRSPAFYIFIDIYCDYNFTLKIVVEKQRIRRWLIILIHENNVQHQKCVWHKL